MKMVSAVIKPFKLDDVRDLAVKDADVDHVIDVICKVAGTGKIGDGKIFVTDLLQVVRIRTGETNESAI